MVLTVSGNNLFLTSAVPKPSSSTSLIVPMQESQNCSIPAWQLSQGPGLFLVLLMSTPILSNGLGGKIVSEEKELIKKMNIVIVIFTQPLRSCRIWHKVNF